MSTADDARPVAIDVTAELGAALATQVSPAELAALERAKSHRASEQRVQRVAADRARRAVERGATLPPNRPPLQFRDRVIEEWIETQREPGESADLCAARLLHEYRALLADPVVTGETKRMRKIRALVDPALLASR